MTDVDLKELGAEIRRRRVALGWTLEQFAEECGLTPNYLGTIEHGKRDSSISTIGRIAAGLGCRIGDLVADDETRLSPAAREAGAHFDRAPREVQEAVAKLLRVYSPKGPRPRDGGLS